jgi:hypothetical protein
MRLRYVNTVEDFVAFALYHHSHSTSFRRMRLMLQCLAVAAALGPAAAREADGREPAYWALSAIIAVVAVVAMPGVLRWSIARSTSRVFRDGTNAGAVGPHELELTESELVERTPVNETRTVLVAVERVVTGGGYTFIYLGTLLAHVIPHTAVTEGDLRAFVEALKQSPTMPPSATSS